MDPAQDPTIQAMAEEVFSLTVMSWRERLASRGQGGAELSESQFLAIDALARAAGPLTVGEVQRSVGVQPAQMSRVIRSLETGFDKPLIHCSLNQADKRRIDVTLTPDGRQAYDDYRAARLSKSADILQRLTEADRSDFIRVCRRIRESYAQPS